MMAWFTKGLSLGLLGTLALASPAVPPLAAAPAPAATPARAVVAAPVALSATAPAVRAYIASRLNAVHRNAAIPAFARKYGLPCSACHTAWPELNEFGQTFKDNGYQMGNERDSPIWTNPAYWPAAVRTTPQWRMERTTNQPVDDGTGGTIERTVTQSGFDIGGADLLMLGTLYKNISFGFVPVFEDGGAALEAVFVRFNNLFKSPWANLKVGKFELNNMLSEKRGMTLSNNGGFYQGYHFAPVGDGTGFDLGENQIGAEWLGHSINSYTRASVAVLEQSNGEAGLTTSQGYDFFGTFDQAFDAGRLGVSRIGVFGYLGQRPTSFITVGGEPIPGTGSDGKTFYRLGAVGDLFLGQLEFIPFFMHAHSDAALGAGTQASKWNDYLLEAHYYVNPQFVFIGRGELVRMSQQVDPGIPDKMGNVDAYTLGYRWYPIMFSRAGLAWIGEISFTKTIGTMPLSGDGAGVDPLTPTTPVKSTSVFLGLDFDF